MDKNRRYSKRKMAKNISLVLYPLNPQIWFRYWNESEYVMRDISMVGLGIYSQENIPVGTPLSLDLRLGRNNPATVRIFGKTKWSKKENDTYRIGISFSWWMDDQDRKIVDTYLEKLNNTN